MKDVRLWGNVLPWEDTFKHLGNDISNDRCVTDVDIASKRAQYISKCLELDQEFYFASGRTKLRLNAIYNYHFTGSPIWDLFGKQILSLEASYNRSVKNMFNLPLQTHRNLIEHVTGGASYQKNSHVKILKLCKTN